MFLSLWYLSKKSAETGSDLRYSLTFGKRHPKHLAVASSRWSLTRIEPHGASFEKRSGHNYFMEDNLLLHAISKLDHV